MHDQGPRLHTKHSFASLKPLAFEREEAGSDEVEIDPARPEASQAALLEPSRLVPTAGLSSAFVPWLTLKNEIRDQPDRVLTVVGISTPGARLLRKSQVTRVEA